MKDSGVRNWLCSLIGAHDEEVRTKNDARRYPSLLTLELIQSEKIDVGGQDIYVYEITPKGRRTIARLAAEKPT
jgi:DNA-binding PadR family transcriptional regulator